MYVCRPLPGRFFYRSFGGTHMKAVQKMFSLADFEAQAKTALGSNAWGYYSSGANQEQTLKDNVEAFSRYRFRPRVLRDVSKLDTKVQLFGEQIEFPICVAPTAMQKMAHSEGEAATARACVNLGTCMILSLWSSTSIEEVAAASGPRGLRWFQLYIYNDKTLTISLIKRAEQAGYKALVITVDSPIFGNKTYFSLPSHLSYANFEEVPPLQMEPHTTWETIRWVQGVTKLPVLVKGVLTAEDAIEAVQHGVHGIVVSNHGARQLDGSPATIDALSEVVKAVDGKVDVFMDSGVRQGTDVLKALALGAKAVFVGRPVLWGLAYKGQEGVEDVLNILKDEFRHTMMLSGCASISDIKPEVIIHESYYYKFPPLSNKL